MTKRQEYLAAANEFAAALIRCYGPDPLLLQLRAAIAHDSPIISRRFQHAMRTLNSTDQGPADSPERVALIEAARAYYRAKAEATTE